MHSPLVEFCCKGERQRSHSGGDRWWLGKDLKMGHGMCVCARAHARARVHAPVHMSVCGCWV